MHFPLHLNNEDLKDNIPLARHILIKIMGYGMIGVFLPAILKFEFWLSFATIFFFEVLFCFLVILLSRYIALPLIAKHGTVISMIVGVLSLILNFLWLYTASVYPLLIYLYPLFCAGYVACFWWAYHISLSGFTQHDKAFGQHTAKLESIGVIAGLISPIIGASIADYLSLNSLYLIAMSIVLLSCIPFFFHQHHHTWSKLKSIRLHTTWSHITKNARFLQIFSVFSYLQCITMLIWPIFLFSAFGSYSKVAAISVISSCILILFLRSTGTFIDRMKQQQYFQRFLQISFRSQSGLRAIVGIGFLFGLLGNILLMGIDSLTKIGAKVNETFIMTNFYKQIGSYPNLNERLQHLYEWEIVYYGSKWLICLIFAILSYISGESSQWIAYIFLIGIIMTGYLQFQRSVTNKISW